jgi:hypothetical protein
MPRVDATQCAEDCWVRVGVYGYPYFHASDEDSALETRNDGDGILMVLAPAGRHRIRLEFAALTRVRMTGTAISLVGVLVMGFMSLRRRLHPRIA